MTIFRLILLSCATFTSPDGTSMKSCLGSNYHATFASETACKKVGSSLRGMPIFTDIYDGYRVEATSCTTQSVVP